MIKISLSDPPINDDFFVVKQNDEDNYITPVWQRWLAAVSRLGKYVYVETTLDFSNTAAQTCTDILVPVPDVQVGAPVFLGVPPAAITANSCYTAWVDSVGSVTVRFNNYSSSAKNPSSGTFTITVPR